MKKIILIILLLATPLVCFGETIILKSGKTIEGKIIERTDKYIKIEAYGVELTYWNDDIEKIEEQEKIIPNSKEEILESNQTFDKNYISEKGELVKTYEAFVNAVKSGDRLEAKKYISRESVKEFETGSEEELQFMIEMMPEFLNNAEESIEGDVGHLKWSQKESYEEEGVPVKESLEIALEFIKEDGLWKLKFNK